MLGCEAERVAESALSTLARRRPSDQDSNDEADSSQGIKSGRSSMADDLSPRASPDMSHSGDAAAAQTAADTAATPAVEDTQDTAGDAEMETEQPRATPWQVRRKKDCEMRCMMI